MKVNQQVKVPFSIGTYKDEVICDVVPMEAGHLLLGRSWQYDRKIIYNGNKVYVASSNTFTGGQRSTNYER